MNSLVTKDFQSIVKIFWSHPKLMDYRKPLFDLMCKHFDVTFFFYEGSDIPNDYKYTVRKSKGRLLTLSDLRMFYKGIKYCDVFISSHLRHKHTRMGIFLAFLLRKRVVVWNESNIISNNYRVRMKIYFDTLFSKGVDAYFITGTAQRSYLHHIGVKDAKIYLSNEYPAVKFDTIDHKAINSLETVFMEKKVILYIGRFIPLKGIEYLIDAFKKLIEERDDVALLLVGEGPLKNKLAQSEKNNKAIIFSGLGNDIKEKAYLFKNCCMTVVSSRIINNRHGEGGPLVTFEALSAGCYVLATDACHAEKYIQNGINGYIARHSNVDDLYEKMKLLLELYMNTPNHKQIVLEMFEKIPGHQAQSEIMSAAVMNLENRWI